MSQEDLSLRAKSAFAAGGFALMAAAVAAGVLAATPDDGGARTLHATFGRAGQGLDTHSEVKIRGIRVGRVVSVALDRDGRAVVGLRIDHGVRVPATAEATVEAVSVFGPKDVVIEPGAAEGTGPFLADGTAISRTVDPIDPADTASPAYELADAFDPVEMGQLLDTFSQVVSGRGKQLSRTVDNSAKLLDLFVGGRDVTSGLIKDTAALGDTFGGKGGRLATTATDASGLLDVAGAHPERYTDLLDQASGFGDRTSTFLWDNRRNTAAVVDTGSRAAAVLNAQLGNLPVLTKGLTGFFGVVGGIMREPGPDGTLMGSADIVLPLDICAIILDVCPVKGGR
ncbi:MlaD family protein [Actinocorallia longicatena]|uniref:Phospholipid/cholesterol/gamma-HCH transport system substrate-binding protein n=1 Tax=Actinocorallia longicatena TaxID=111803 RepID=A0ABP6Q3N2_9ACTN